MEENYTDCYEKLSKLQWLLQRQHIMSHAQHGPLADTTRGQGRVLAALKIQPNISTKDLSYLLGIRVPSLNELLNKLEKGGFIVRTPSEADKRVMIIRLTEKGKSTRQEDVDYSGTLDCLSAEEQERFGEYLDRIIAALEAQVGDEPDRDGMETWMRAARLRMGHEQFEHFMSLRQYGFGGHGWSRPSRERHNDRRFDRDYDGSMPEDRRESGFDFGCGRGGRSAPHQPPKGHHSPEEPEDR